METGMFQALIFGLPGSVGAMAGAGLLLAFPDTLRNRLLPCLLSYATGTLLGAAFLGCSRRVWRMPPPKLSARRCWLVWSSSSSWKNWA